MKIFLRSDLKNEKNISQVDLRNDICSNIKNMFLQIILIYVPQTVTNYKSK